MKWILLIFGVLTIVFISGCVQTGQITRDNANTTNMSDTHITDQNLTQEQTNNTQTEEQNQTDLIIDPCEGIPCENSTIQCLDGFNASCENECVLGECDVCIPDCIGHDVLPEIKDLCEEIICEESIMQCPDGFNTTCENECVNNTCSVCTPDCTGHDVCEEFWSCTEWADCIGGQQTRICEDMNNCGTLADKPVETQECEEIETTGDVVFSEIYYDTLGKDSEEEWLEIYNPGTLSIDLRGWTISDNSGTWTFPEIVINPQDYLIIARDQAGFQNLFGCLPDIDTFTHGLNNNGDQLTLKDINGLVTSFVAWEGGHDGVYPEWDIEAKKGTSLIKQGQGEISEDWLSNQEPDPAC